MRSGWHCHSVYSPFWSRLTYFTKLNSSTELVAITFLNMAFVMMTSSNATLCWICVFWCVVFLCLLCLQKCTDRLGGVSLHQKLLTHTHTHTHT